MKNRKVESVKVELIFDEGCPHVDAARRNLVRAFKRVGTTPRWIELDNGALRTGAGAARYGSPTILIDDNDIAGLGSVEQPCCRIYRDSTGQALGAPPVDLIVAALKRVRS